MLYAKDVMATCCSLWLQCGSVKYRSEVQSKQETSEIR